MKLSQTVFNLQSRNEYMVEMSMFNVQRAITPKVGIPELHAERTCRTHKPETRRGRFRGGKLSYITVPLRKVLSSIRRTGL